MYCDLDKDEAFQKEIKLIKYYDSTNNKYGYNITTGGDGCHECHLNQNKLSNKNIANYMREINEYDLNFNYIRSYITVNDCGRANNISPTNITKCAMQKHKTCKNRIFLYKDETYNMGNDEVREFVDNKRKDYLSSLGNFENSSSKIALINDDGSVIKIFDGVKIAANELQIDSSTISKVCRNKLKSTKGYKFKYLSNDELLKLG